MIKSFPAKLKNSAYTIAFISIFISGCAPAFRANPFLVDRIKDAKMVAIMPLDIEVYKVSAGGIKELVDEFSDEAKQNIRLSIEKRFRASQRYQIKYFPKPEDITEPATKQLLKDTLALFKVVDFSVISHTYIQPDVVTPTAGLFPEKIKNFDYTLGPQIKPLSEYEKSDLFLFIKGGDYLSSGGRIALMVCAAIFGFTPVSAGPTHLSAALVDAKTGDVLWYNFLCPPSGGFNLRNGNSVESFISILLKDFPDK